MTKPNITLISVLTLVRLSMGLIFFSQKIYQGIDLKSFSETEQMLFQEKLKIYTVGLLGCQI